MTTLVVEDPQVRQLYPITLARPAFAITCGGYRLIDHLSSLAQPLQALVRPHLHSIVLHDFPEVGSVPRNTNEPASASRVLVVNARLVPSWSVRQQLKALQQEDRPAIVHAGETVAAAVLPQRQLHELLELGEEELFEGLRGSDLPLIDLELPLLEYPHDVIRHHQQTMEENLGARASSGSYREIADGVLAAAGARLGQHVVTDTSAGPILLEPGATVGPHCVLQGPLLIGAAARILEHAAIKDCVAIGHAAKVGGEVEVSIVEPYTNKQHHGFLGHSYLGSWINLGAGTCNSDLKNTYGQVNMDYNGRRIATDMQFVGVTMGDYGKTAINTGFFTGKTVGVCSMMYGFVTTNVPSFVNYARLFGQVTAIPVEVMVATQARMFARRDIPQRPCDIQLIHDMFELTRHERELGSVPLEPLSL